MTSGDGWTRCAAGHRHWGLFGAAGLLVSDGENVILQHRAPWTHEGDSWGIPGGARNSDEDAVQTALREAHEEARLQASDVDPIGLFVDDHEGWAYTTVVARPTADLRPIAANAESVSVQWHSTSEVAGLPLHTGFAAAWRHLQDVPPPLYLIVTGDAASDPLVAALARIGVRTDRLPSGMTGGGLDRLLPHVVEAGSIDSSTALAVIQADGGQVLLASSSRDLALLA
jgi:8-oxo-dGTP pyrophosphatase MutT (NUDIX family)